jgi:hypothetical protein
VAGPARRDPPRRAGAGRQHCRLIRWTSDSPPPRLLVTGRVIIAAARREGPLLDPRSGTSAPEATGSDPAQNRLPGADRGEEEVNRSCRPGRPAAVTCSSGCRPAGEFLPGPRLQTAARSEDAAPRTPEFPCPSRPRRLRSSGAAQQRGCGRTIPAQRPELRDGGRTRRAPAPFLSPATRRISKEGTATLGARGRRSRRPGVTFSGGFRPG